MTRGHMKSGNTNRLVIVKYMNVEMWSLLKAGNIKTVITLIGTHCICYWFSSKKSNEYNYSMFIKQKPYLKIV